MKDMRGLRAGRGARAQATWSRASLVGRGAGPRGWASALTGVADDTHEIDVETPHEPHACLLLLRLPGAPSRRARSTPVAPRGGGGLPASEPGLGAGTHDRAITLSSYPRGRQRPSRSAAVCVIRTPRA